MSVFTEKLGPLPVYAWGAMAGLAVVAYTYMRPGSSGGGTASPTTLPAPTTTDTGYVPSGPVYGSPTPNTVGTPIENNQSWLTSAVQLLTGKGVAPLDAQTALQSYLQGGSLSVDQQKIVNDALMLKGVAPEGTNLPQLAPAPPINYTDPNLYASYQRVNSTGSISGILKDGSIYHFSPQEWSQIVNTGDYARKPYVFL